MKTVRIATITLAINGKISKEENGAMRNGHKMLDDGEENSLRFTP